MDSALDQKLSQIRSLLDRAKIVFWDFDGVIKDSVEVKAFAYQNLFLPFGLDLGARIKKHHENNSGISRFEKIPLYLAWAGESAQVTQVDEYCSRFSILVKRAVIECPWVPGVREYLIEKHNDKFLILITATPQQEIEEILKVLGIDYCFREVYGAPKKKAEAIKEVLSRLNCAPEQSLFIGDSLADMQSAEANLVPFILRATTLNLDIQANFTGLIFMDLENE